VTRHVRYDASRLETILGALAVGVVGGALTFAWDELAVWTEAAPFGPDVTMAAALVMGFALAMLELDMRTFTAVTLGGLVVSYFVYNAFLFSPQLADGMDPATFFFYFTYRGLGGGALLAWLFFFPPLLLGGAAPYVLYRNGPFS
jgi:hypothetical protein